MSAPLFRVISVLDPALDYERMAEDTLAKYASTRDLAVIEPFLRPGVAPTIYAVREVPHELWESYVMAASNDSDRARRCFQCGVVNVENMYSEDGFIPGQATLPVIGKSGVMADEALQRFSPAEREEIGAVVYYRSFLPRRIARTYRLPRSCAVALEQLLTHRADANQSSPASSNATASSGEASARPQPATIAPTSAPSGASSGGPTVATAQETAA
jgi:hypothetical protein